MPSTSKSPRVSTRSSTGVARSQHRPPSSDPASTSEERRHVLPKVCVICHESGKFKRDIRGVKKKESLISAESLEGGKLVSSATLLQRTDILRLFDGKDLVAIEAKYHKRCYQSLVSQAEKRKREVPSDDVRYSKSFTAFCEKYIDTKILAKGKIMTLAKLRVTFIRMIRAIEGKDATGYRSYNLKRRLRAVYPQLQFKENPGIGGWCSEGEWYDRHR